MQCHTIFVLIVLIYTCKSSASIIDLNETTFASLPPLYALEAWSHCQRPGDVYCVVDAVLVAAQPSPLLQLLQDYSKQTLKHYNRTIIHRGVCVSQCDRGKFGASGARAAAQRCVNQSVLEYGLQAEVTAVDYCMEADAQPVGSSARALAVFCIVLVALVLVATGLHVMCDRCAMFDGNKYLLAFSLKQNWAILTYDRSKPRSDDRMKDVACMEGVRFIAMQCVIFSHVLFICLYSYIDNPQFVEKMYDQFGWKVVMNSPLWLQTFFSLSGFLTAYSVLLCEENSPLTFIKCLRSIVNRWVRITPLAVFALWFTIAWFPLLGSGPQWSWLVTRESQDCAERWWWHLLYVHNHLPLGKLCMGHTWYLAVDMQLHVLGIFILLLLVRYRGAAAPALAALVTASSVAAGLLVYWHDLAPIITAQSPEALRTMFAGSKLMSLVYLPSWMNFSGYACGMGAAFLLYRNQSKGIKLSQNKWFNVLFHLSLHLGGCVVLCGVLFLADEPRSRVAAALYSATDRTLVAVCFNIFLLGCVSRCKSAFRDLLDWRGFHTLGRLSYCAFLIHFIILRLTLASNTQLGHATVFSLIALLVTASTLTYAAAIPLCLLIELPSIQLWKALTERERRDPDTSPVAPPPVPVITVPAKAFDLVAHIRRRQDL